MNQRLTANVEREGDDGCIAPNPKLDAASRGTALAGAPVQFFKAAIDKMFDGQSRVCASGLIASRFGIGFE